MFTNKFQKHLNNIITLEFGILLERRKRNRIRPAANTAMASTPFYSSLKDRCDKEAKKIIQKALCLDHHKEFQQIVITYMLDNNLSNADFYKKADLSKQVFHNFFLHNKVPGRNTLLSILLAMELDEMEINNFLQWYGYHLSSKGSRDRIIIAIQHECLKELRTNPHYKHEIANFNELLCEYNFMPLSTNTYSPKSETKKQQQIEPHKT